METTYKHKWLGFIGIALLSFGCYLDYTVVNIALPAIQQDLHANLMSLQWVMNIYFLALCVLATVMGRFGDLFGRRRCLYIGAGVFTLASILAGLSQHMYLLIFGRLLQGISAAIIFPIGISLVPQIFPEHQRQKAVAWFGCIGGIALALGPLLGGLIVTYLGWRWIFFINVPICTLGYLCCFNTLKEEEPVNQQAIDLDIKGMLLLACSLCGIVLSLIYSQSAGWTDPFTTASLTIGLIAAAFLVRVEQQQKNPLVDFKDFKNLMFCSGAILCFLAGVLSAVTLFFEPLYLQIIKQQSTQFSGFVLFAIPLSVFVVAFIIGSLLSRLGIVNTILVALAIACLATLLQVRFSTTTSLAFIVFTFVCLGGMWAMGNTVSIIAAQSAVSADRKSVATGSMVTLFNLGGSIGITISVVLYNLLTNTALSSITQAQNNNLSAVDLTTLKQLIVNPALSLQTSLTDELASIFNSLFMQGFTGVMVFLFMATLTGFGLVLKFKRSVGPRSKLQHS